MIIEVHKDKDLNFKMETEIFDVRLLGPRAHARQKPADLALNLFERHPNAADGNCLVYSLLDYAAIRKGSHPKGKYDAHEVRNFKLPLFYGYASYLSRVDVDIVKGIHESKIEVVFVSVFTKCVDMFHCLLAGY